MKYMGSKARHAKEILPIILEGRSVEQVYVEPFVGGANTIDKVPGARIASDFNPYVAALWDATSRGWLPPKFVSEDDYELAKSSTDMPYKGYVGFALSFGGKFFGGYRRDVAGTKGCIDNMKTQSRRAYESFEKQAKMMNGVSVFHSDYKNLQIPCNSIIYCDPPYAGTTKYATGSFNHKDFWDWCIEMHSMHHRVFVSEYCAPEGWRCVWEKTVNNTLTKDTGSKQGVERLFTK